MSGRNAVNEKPTQEGHLYTTREFILAPWLLHIYWLRHYLPLCWLQLSWENRFAANDLLEVSDCKQRCSTGGSNEAAMLIRCSSHAETIKNYDVVRPHIVYEDGTRPYPKMLTLEISIGGANFTLKLEMNEYANDSMHTSS